MKRNVSFLFLFMIIWVIPIPTFAFHFEKTDSIYHYRKISKNRGLPAIDRIKAIDKAIYLAANAADTTLLSQIAYKTRIYSDNRDYDNAIAQTKVLLKKAQALNNTYYNAIAYNKMGWYLNVQKQPLEAFKSYVRALELFTEIDDSLHIIKVSKRASAIQSSYGDLDGAEFTIVNALDYSDALDDISELSWFYDNLGRVYRQRTLWKEAIRHHRKALQLENSPLSKATLLNNYGITLIQAKKFDDAILHLEVALAYGDIVGKKLRLSLLDNYALAKAKLNDPTALKLLEEVLLSRKKIDDIEGEYASHIHLSEIYENVKNTKKVQFHAQQAYNIAARLQNTDAVVKALDFLIPVTEESSSLFKEYAILSDSLKNDGNKAKFEFAKLRYDVEKAEERESLALQLQSVSKLREHTAIRRRNWALTALLAIALLTTVWILYQKERSKKQRIEDQYNTEKRLAKKLHDELANEIYLVMSQLESDKATPQIAEKLDHIYKMSRDLSRETQPIQTDSTFPDALAMSLQTYTTDNRKLILRGLESITWDLIAPEKKIEIYRVLQELMTNMRKHSRATFVALVFKYEENALAINYSDNGVGTILSPKKRNTGLNNIESRLTSIKGTVAFDSAIDEGFRALLSIPI